MSGPDERFEDALQGASPLSPEDDLGAFVRDVRDAFPTRPLLAQEAHVEATAEAARTISNRDRTPARKESHMRLPRLRSKAAMIVAGLVVAMSSFGGLAAAGALPGDVQNGVANAVGTVGLDLPGGSDETEDDATEVDDDANEVEAPDADESEAPEAEESEAPEADEQGEDEKADDQGEDQESKADDQGEDEQSGDQGEDQESEADDQGEDEQSGSQSQDDQGEQSDDHGENEGGED
jgi:hypothetical protein